MKKSVQNKVLAILLSCMFMIGLFPTVVLAEGYESESIPAEITSANFSGGKGTEENPYQIAKKPIKAADHLASPLFDSIHRIRLLTAS